MLTQSESIITAANQPFEADDAGMEGLPPRREIPGKRRVVKDVLPVGRWLVGFDNETGEERYWKVTRESLDTLVDAFSSMTSDGIRPGLYWTHSNGWTPEGNANPESLREFISVAFDARSRIDDIEAFFVHDDTLHFSAYVSDEDFADLTGKRRDVSIGVIWNYRDGRGKLWPFIPWHVAVVGHGTVPGQQPFIEMQSTLHKPEEQALAMTFETTLDGINVLLRKCGMKPMPTEGDGAVTVDSFDQLFAFVVGMVADDEEPEDTEDQDTDSEEVPILDADTTIQELSAKIREQGLLISELSSTIRGLGSEKSNRQRADYEQRVNAMVANGFPAAQASALLDIGESSDWSASLLDAFDTGDVVELGSHTGSLRTPNPPEVNNGMSSEQLQAARATLGLPPKE